jgi:hypothetical protein
MLGIRAMASVAILVLSLIGTAQAQTSASVDRIAAIAADSQCARVDWKNRGLAPKAYLRGMALVFARAVCQSNRDDVKVLSAARATPGPETSKTDALTWYDETFTALGMGNTTSGVDTLRHAYTLMIGLGMRESSGGYCVGRDRSANFTTADSAEAGVFQTSYGARTKHSAMAALYAKYKADQSACLLNVFKRSVSCSRNDAENFGEGEGRVWQQLTKTCPAFAVEYAGVLIRVHGGSKGEFGPLRRRAAQVLPVCDAMLKQVQDVVQADSQMCTGL